MQVTGQCECLPHVINRDCSACEPGYYNLQSREGCQRYKNALYCNYNTDLMQSKTFYDTSVFCLFLNDVLRCNCNPVGSTNGHCDILRGQCECQPGVTGQHCDRCEVNFFGFSSSGCKRKRPCLDFAGVGCISICSRISHPVSSDSLRLRRRGLSDGSVQRGWPMRMPSRLCWYAL